LEVAKNIGADGVKLSTTEFYNNRLFDAALSAFDIIYVSVGGLPVEDIDDKLSSLDSVAAKKICLMYGFQAEPTPLDQNNLLKLKLFKEKYPLYRIGFMDHSDGGLEQAFHLPLVALGVGVDVIEKHITLDRELEIEDFVSGLTPSWFAEFVELIRQYEQVLGEESLKLSVQEEEYRSKAVKSVVAVKPIQAGGLITEESIALKRSSIPITENSVFDIDAVIGKKVKVDIEAHAPILRGQI
jgi:sialic acid synthase SpsE